MEEGKKNIINILGINISTLGKNEVLEKIEEFLSDGKQHQIATPNPEIILKALQDEELFYILNNADLAVPDAMGVKIAGWFSGKNLKRITGADLIKDILEIAQKRNKKVAILNWDRGLSSAADIKRVIENNYLNLEFIVEDVAREGTNSIETRRGASLQNFRQDILFCALGAPWQEKLIFHNLKNWPSVKIAMGVGGSFDFLTGKTKRAPRVMRALGLEWLWRLFAQKAQPPLTRFSRIKRIAYSAIILFPLKFLKWRFVLPFLYRPNVACILFKKDSDGFKILLVQRSDQENHWQLPQGGTDGDGLEGAGRKELSEELGTDRFKIIACYKNLHKYKFDERLGKYNLVVKNIVDYKGQKQGLCIAEFLGNDEDIKINFWDHNNWKWINAENLASEVHPVRQEAAKIFLKKFNEVIKFD